MNLNRQGKVDETGGCTAGVGSRSSSNQFPSRFPREGASASQVHEAETAVVTRGGEPPATWPWYFPLSFSACELHSSFTLSSTGAATLHTTIPVLRWSSAGREGPDQVWGNTAPALFLGAVIASVRRSVKLHFPVCL